jgi:hypothetical protein
MKRFSLRYLLLTSRFDQVWFPLAFWLLFLVLGVIRGEQYIVDTSRAYLGAVIPLVGGILAAYAILEDPALELRFATPVRTAQTLAERLAPTFLTQTFFALTYQLFALALRADFSTLFPGWADLQLAWLIPTLSLMAFGCFAALAAAQPTTGALLTGMVWLVELVARGWFAENRIGQYFLVFMSPFMTDHPALRANQIGLAALSLALLLAAWALLHRQERYV